MLPPKSSDSQVFTWVPRGLAWLRALRSVQGLGFRPERNDVISVPNGSPELCQLSRQHPSLVEVLQGYGQRLEDVSKRPTL